ncbi:hypothetical protein [Nocardia fluminea]|uniref:hypothetical protein n=1 Tax=Nocardia fluminea TaxID=134984 RepID=UPI00343B9ADB
MTLLLHHGNSDCEGGSVFRRSKPRDVDALRSRYLANREQVTTWIAEWDCPEVEWRPLPEVDRDLLKYHAPYLPQYEWLVEGSPIVPQITAAYGYWRFGELHAFESLDIRIECTLLDPGYLAEKLALGVDAAHLDGWLADDLQPLYEWLFEGADTRPPTDAVRGQQRTGFLLFDFSRWPGLMSGPGVRAELKISKTRIGLDGSPLDDSGVSA